MGRVIRLGVVTIAVLWVLHILLTLQVGNSRGGDLVEGAPPRPQPLYAPYLGPHPSQIPRPEESFEFPIRLGQVGPIEPLFGGPLRYPFLCGIKKSRLGQPLVDNNRGWGMPVYEYSTNGPPSDKVMGYSKDCLLPTRAAYYYRNRVTGEFLPLNGDVAEIDRIQVNGREVDFIIRVEIGVINRFLYLVAALKGEDETLTEPNPSNWNRRLIYQFRGGVGIGYKQGKVSPGFVFSNRGEQLAQGYAVIMSSGTQTSNHYNIGLAEDTALRVKRQFVGLYGEPDYTVGIGGSGGAIQQYLLAQNNPGIIDAAIAEYSYPDMLSQTLYAFDCELTEFYFDVLDRNNDRWRHWENRSLIQGMNASSDVTDRFHWVRKLSLIKLGILPEFTSGSSECVNGWRGLVPLVNNPKFAHFGKYFNDDVADETQWSYWESVKHLYGTDDYGVASSTWDNEGVQYGLAALIEGNITLDEFLDLNATLGGWKHPQEMKQEQFWYMNNDVFPFRVSVWSHQNMVLGSIDSPAPRNRGSIQAMQAAYRSGHMFLGKLNIPVIDLRHYLEDSLDMHHSHASFSARARLLNGQGHADNQLIWMTRKPHNPEPLAFATMDQWMANIRQQPQRSIADNRPEQGVDTCFDKMGNVIAAGASVWDGDWNNKPQGQCSEVYPSYSVTRSVAGAPVSGDVLKCHLQPVAQAVANGVYGDIDVGPVQETLERIFPTGVCDYSQGDMGRPEDLP